MSRTRPHPLRPTLRAAAAAALLLTGACGRGPEEGVVWRHETLVQALEEARASGRPVLADVYATWCAPCLALEGEVWETGEGRALADGLVPFKVDFDQEEGQAVKRRYKVLGLPTVLFLDPEGVEIDRVEGYPGREAFLEEARRYASGHSRLDEARRAVEESPDAPEAQVRLGHLLLVRSMEEEGVGLLERASGGPDRDAAAESLFLLGRYFTRAAERPERAIPYWRRLHTGFEGTEWSGGALYWFLKSHDEAGHLDEGLEALEGPAMLRAATDYEMAAAYLYEAGREAEAGQIARRGLSLFPDEEALKEFLDEDR